MFNLLTHFRHKASHLHKTPLTSATKAFSNFQMKPPNPSMTNMVLVGLGSAGLIALMMKGRNLAQQRYHMPMG